MYTNSVSYMHRCLELAANGLGHVAPNPMVGAVLVFDDRIIGEGYHQKYGESHAEVNAISHAIKNGNEKLISKSVLYVSLEPCNHFGKTPPCTELIISNKIPAVIIGCKDPFDKVNGSGIKRLLHAGIKVETGMLEKECTEMNRRFFTYHIMKRPYVILKYAQSSDHFIAPSNGSVKKISNEYSDILVHKWRSEEAAIMVGTRTAESDNPMLTVRKWEGKNPIRVVIDKSLRLPKHLHIFDASSPTIVINELKNEKMSSIEHVKIDFSKNVPEQILATLFERKLLSVLIEGGSNLLNQFIQKNLWDEARIITADKYLDEGIQSPEINGILISSTNIRGDKISILKPSFTS